MNKALKYKTIEKVFTPKIVPEGVGAKVRRIIGISELPRLDPFLMLDHFFVKLPAGFPDHPHRGFETVTYMLEGAFFHEDFKGHKGKIEAGDIQWMTAGKGIVHSEMPASSETEAIGLQLWINLENKNRMIEPRYQEIDKTKIPAVEKDGVKVKVIAGEAFNAQGPIECKTPAFYLDIDMQKNSRFSQHIPIGWNSLVYVLKGKGFFGESKKEASDTTVIVLKNDDTETLAVETKDSECRFVIIAGKPIGEKIFQYGPFVMGTQEELNKTLADYQKGKNGFEGSHGWSSEISKFGDEE